jgi:hypothetical protein
MHTASFQMEHQAQSEYYVDPHFCPGFIGLSMPPVLPGSLLHSSEHQILNVLVSGSPQDFETSQNFDDSAHSLRKHVPYSSVLVSSGKCGVDIERSNDMDLHSTDSFNKVQRKPESSADEFARNNAHGAVKRCAANEKRLKRMNELLESLADGAWSSFDDRHTLARKLKINRYYPTIRLKMLQSRLDEFQPKIDDIDSFATDPNLYENARKCGEEISDEVNSLRMLEEQALEVVRAMIASMSADTPICAEEAQAMLSRVKALFNPARKALSATVSRLAAEKECHSLIAR